MSDPRDCVLCRALKGLARIALLLAMVPAITVLLRLNEGALRLWWVNSPPAAETALLPPAVLALSAFPPPIVYLLDEVPRPRSAPAPPALDLHAVSAACNVPVELLKEMR